jgi:hypothetical protein
MRRLHEDQVSSPAVLELQISGLVGERVDVAKFLIEWAPFPKMAIKIYRAV